VQPSVESSVQLPELVTNPLASIRATPTEVQVAGEWITIPALSAADWLELLMIEDVDLDTVFPGLAEEADQEFVLDQLLDGQLHVNDVEKLALQVITEVSGRPWWVAYRMIQIAKVAWSTLGGRLILSRIDATQISLSAWLDALWLVLFESINRDKWTMLSAQIEAVPPSEMPENPLESMEMSMDTFSEMMRG
jgi:hypothetical protein